MTDRAIRVENLRKRYRLGEREQRYGYVALRDVLANAMKAPFRALRGAVMAGRSEDTALQKAENENRNSKLEKRRGVIDSGERQSGGKPPQGHGGSKLPHSMGNGEYIWALDGVSLEVKHGEAVGLIGRNGAGKTTLLKILSRITKPTEGRAEIHGRVGSLLEVGTGFHPELTGRENIYLNGAILGMKKTEIDRKFDEIAAFAEVEKFLDTPVKHYSSGMYVRLAFAVAAHLEPEILLVDEVLAVGDAAFQKKCLGKMSEVTRAGRTVVFVSHNMSAIENLCAEAYQIDGGRIVRAGDTRTVVSGYLAEQYRPQANPFADCQRSGNGKVRVTSFRLESPEGQPLEVARSGEPAVFAFGFENGGCTARDRVSFSFSVHTDHEVALFHYYSHFSDVYFENLPARGIFKCVVPELALAPGNYLVMCRTMLNGDQLTGIEADWPRVYVPITVVGGDFYGTGDVNVTTWAPMLVKGKWSMDKRGEGRREVRNQKFEI